MTNQTLQTSSVFEIDHLSKHVGLPCSPSRDLYLKSVQYFYGSGKTKDNWVVGAPANVASSRTEFQCYQLARMTQRPHSTPWWQNLETRPPEREIGSFTRCVSPENIILLPPRPVFLTTKTSGFLQNYFAICEVGGNLLPTKKTRRLVS